MKIATNTLMSIMLLAAGLATSCRHKLETHSTIEPIHITIDVNVRVDRALDDYFSDIDSMKAGGDVPAESDANENKEESK